MIDELAGLWAMEPKRLESFVRMAERAAKGPRIEADAAPAYTVRADGVAEIPIQGVMIKSVPAWLKGWARVTGSTDTKAALEQAITDPSVKSVLLDIESPGGSMAGIQELADAVHAHGKTKPIHAVASDLMASAAYWVASQASHISANATAEVGSIGVYSVIVDSSKAAEDDGLRVHVIRSAPLKGAGVPGAPITDEQLAVEQELIDKAAAMFTAAVARGRGMSLEQAEIVSTGRVWFADDAKARGLIDSVGGKEVAAQRSLAASLSIFAAANPPTITESAPRAPVGGSMSGEDKSAREAELEKKLALAEAKEAASLAALKQITENHKAEIVEDGVKSGRITPSMRAAVDKYASACGEAVADLSAFVASLPVQTKPAAIGATGEPTTAKPEAPDELKRLARGFGVSIADIDLAQNVAGISADGKLIMKDGTVRERSN